jgi:hypothetical protein
MIKWLTDDQRKARQAEIEKVVKECFEWQLKTSCQHTEVTVDPASENWCDQCCEIVYEVPVTITGGGINYVTTDPAQEAGE